LADVRETNRRVRDMLADVREALAGARITRSGALIRFADVREGVSHASIRPGRALTP
jgi:hypothetical protein